MDFEKLIEIKINQKLFERRRKMNENKKMVNACLIGVMVLSLLSILWPFLFPEKKTEIEETEEETFLTPRCFERNDFFLSFFPELEETNRDVGRRLIQDGWQEEEMLECLGAPVEKTLEFLEIFEEDCEEAGEESGESKWLLTTPTSSHFLWGKEKLAKLALTLKN